MKFYNNFNEMFNATGNQNGGFPIFNASDNDLVSAFVSWITDEKNGNEVWKFCQSWNLVDEVLEDAGAEYSSRYFDGTSAKQSPKASFLAEVQSNSEWASGWASVEEILEDWECYYFDGVVEDDD